MFFRALTLFRFSAGVADGQLLELDKALAGKRLRECGSLEQATRGFVSPYGRTHEQLVHRLGCIALITMGRQDRKLKGSVVNDELSKRLQEVTEKQGRRVGGKERKRMKEEILADFLPRAFVESTSILGYIDPAGGWLVIDTSSRKAAEEFVSELRDALESFPVTPMAPEESPRVLMTDWVVSGKLPSGLAFGDDCELRDPAESGAIIRCRRQDLETEEVREHLKTGKQVYQLGLVFQDRISFVLGEDLVVRKLKLTDVVLDSLDGISADNAIDELDSRFALMTLEFNRLLVWLNELFKLPRPTGH
jgi:recombination associated protein RdgC